MVHNEEIPLSMPNLVSRNHDFDAEKQFEQSLANKNK